MSNTFSFAVLSQAQILGHANLLNKLSEVFKKNYGIWSDKGRRPGHRIAMSTKLIKHQLLFDEEACGVVVASIGDPLNVIGQAFYYKFSTQNLGNVCWITQLVTCQEFRQKGIATKLINVALGTDNFSVCGLVTSNPYAIRALERATSSIYDRTFIENHSNELIQNSRLVYIDHDMIVDKHGSVNTQFYCDHTDILKIIEKEKKSSRWKFGELLEVSCQGLTSVFRVQADTCGRLWVLDSGQTDVTIKPKQVCPPQIFIFDLSTDKLLLRYALPEEFIKQDSLYSNIAVDIRDNDCLNAHAYVTDVWRYGLVVFSLEKMRSWRVTDHLFYPEPLAAAYNVHGLEFEWVDGIFGLSLSPYNRKAQDRILYFHPMSSFREFYVKTSVICNETGWSDIKDAFKVMGQSRGRFGHASASGMDRNGIMFFNMVTRDSIGCWDSRKPYKRDNIGVVAKSTKSLVFPNDLKIDNEERQSVWVLSNRLPFFLYRELNKNEFNFRIMSAYTDEAIKDTICDPDIKRFDTFRSYPDGDDCY